MKKRILSVVVLVVLLVSLLIGCGAKSSGGQDTSWEDIKKKGEFVLGLDDSFPPMGFRDKNNEIVGFDIDLAKEVGKRLGLKVVLKPVDWDGVVMSLDNKDIDIIWNGLTITPERQKQINFSKVYLKNRQIILVQANSNIKSKKDLAGKIVGLQLGSSSEDALNADKATSSSLKNIVKHDNNVEALLDLEAGRVDAVVIDEVVGRYYMTKKPNTYKVLSEDLGEESYGVGFRKSDNSFREMVDKTLDEMKADGTANKISQKWFGKDIITK